jgi:hypothetical protein
MSSSSNSTIFNFEVNKKQFFFKNLTDSILIKLEKITESVAILYFTNTLSENTNESIDIPEGIKVYTYDLNKQQIEETPLKNSQKYALCFSDDYIIVYNNQIVFKMKSTRGWNISS